MGSRFWILRFILVAAVAFAVLAIAELAKGHAMAQALVHAAVWAPITAGVWVAVAIHRSRRCRLPQQPDAGG
jgi:hypothetical protein